MTLTQFALRYRPVTYVLLTAILGLGTLAIFLLSWREDPDLQSRLIQVVALYPGATAQQTEALATEKLERSLLEIDEVKTVQSTSRPGIAVLTVEAADQAHDMPQFREDVRNRIADIRSDLPSGVVSVQINDRYADTSALILAITEEGANDRQREDLAKTVRDRLRCLPDVGEVRLIGEQQERIEIALSSQRMARLAVTPSQVAESISRRNVLPSAGGSLAAGNVRFSIEPTGNLVSEQKLPGLLVAAPNGAPVYLRDIATVTRAYTDPPPYLLRVNGRPAVGVSVTMRRGGNIITLGQEVQQALAALRPDLPAGAEIVTLNDLPRSVEQRMGEFASNLISGMVLIFVVMYLFMGLRSALIVGALLPVTILGAFGVMYLCGRDIQQISISALILSLGLVVDNSIVVVDNIERKLSEGMERERAAAEGVDELRVPLLTSNLTTVASFAPLALLSGATGEFLRDLGIVTTISTLLSLLFNVTLAPLMAIRFMQGLHEETAGPLRRLLMRGVDRLRDGISWMAVRGLRKPGLTVGLATVGLILAFAAIPRLGTQLFPSAQRDQFTIDVWLPEGRDIRATEQATAQVEAILKAEPGVRSFASYVGQGGPRFFYNVSPEASAPNYAQILVNTTGIDETHRLVAQIQRAADTQITEARVTAKTLEQGPPIGAPIAVRVMGDDLTALRATAEQVKGILNSTPGARSVYHDYGELPLALKVEVNADRAALMGLSSQDVAEATQMGFSGLTASYLREGDKEIPIQLRLDHVERADTQSLSDLYLPSGTGAMVPLRQIASVSLAPQEGRIVRRNYVRTLTVLAYTDNNHLASQVLADAQQRIAALSLPHGVSIGYGGEQEEIGRSFLELFLILCLSIVANLVIVVWEFNSFPTALSILAAVPFSMTGAILGLFLMHQPFGFMAFLGITSLSGVVTNHAIVLFEYAREEQQQGMTLDQVLVAAGRKRLRPVLLTVLLSIGGLLPQAVHGGSLWPPMAWSLIFGLLMSLPLTLVIVPSFYKILTTRRT